MPKYLDHHAAVQLPPQVVQQMVDQIKSGRPDENGIRPINDFIATDGSQAWCLTEAPNPGVVHKVHEALGLKLGPGDVIEVMTLV